MLGNFISDTKTVLKLKLHGYDDDFLQARSKLPKKRRRVLPVEQPRPKRCDAVCAGVMGAAGLIGNRRMATTSTTPGTILKDTFGTPKLGTYVPIANNSRIIRIVYVVHYRTN